jgi:nicotinamidase-related amidase
MPQASVDPARSVLLVIDIQPSFMAGINEADRVVDRSAFLIEIARLLDVPVLASEQYPGRMGRTDEKLLRLLAGGPEPVGKMTFSCAGDVGFLNALRETERRQAVIVGIETHICVSQTAHDLLRFGYEVVVCPDAVSARTLDRHKLGLERIRDAGAVPAHTEAIAYEWMGTAENPLFREALKIVKEHR